MTGSTARGAGRIGTTIRGKYKIDRLLGEGGMAVVYAATHRNNKRFAVKMLHPELSIHEDIRTRFLKEGYVANTVDHPGAVAVVDDDIAEDNAAFLVMELLEGAPVDVLFERAGGKLPLKATLTIVHELLDVLASAHEKGIVHRDLKPANLFVTKDGALKVLDFGIARIREAAQTSAQVTSTGMMLGTPAYMPPEQAMAKSSEIDARTDLWAVGATIFTLLSGQLVHEGENATQLVIAAATQPARSLASVAPDVQPPVVAFVARSLSFSKVERWQSAGEMKAAVAALHRAVCGGDVGRDALVDLVGSRAMAPMSSGPTLPLAHTPARASHPLPSAAPATTERDATIPADDYRHVGLSTAVPVSSERGSPALAPKGGRGPLVAALLALPVVAAVAAAIAIAYVKHASPSAIDQSSVIPAGAALSAGPTVLETKASRAIATAPPTPDLSASTEQAPAASAPVSTNSPKVTAPTKAAAGPKSAAQTNASTPTSAPVSSPAMPTSASTPSPAPSASCKVVTDYDGEGQAHFRKVCR